MGFIVMKPIFKFNGGNGAQLCVKCRIIIHTGPPSKRVLCNKCLSDLVYNRKTKHKEGYTEKEINKLLSTIGRFNLNMKRFNDALTGITCMMFDDEIVTYHCDILTALRVAMEDRPMRAYEWD